MYKLKQKILFLISSSACLFLSGCTILNTSTVIVGEKRAAISSESVKLYTTPPKNYIEVAILSVEAGHDFRSTQDLMDSAVERLKVEAAKVGANGVLLANVGRRDNNTVGIGIGNATTNRGFTSGTAMAVSSSGRGFQTISGTAIFVAE